MNLKNITKMCASVLLAIMIVGMPLYLVTSSVFGSNGDYDIRPPILESDITPLIGIAPIRIMVYPTTIHMTDNTIFYLNNVINLDDYFINPDEGVRLAYRIDYPSEVADVVLEGNRITSITSYGLSGDFIITAIASNYYGSTEYDFTMRIDPKETLLMDEDVTMWHEIGNYLPSSIDSYELKTTQGISSKIEMEYNESALLSITPDANWFGEGRIYLEVYASPYSIPTPPPVQDPMFLDVDLPSWLFGCFEFDVVVNGINDPPTSEGAEFIRLTMTSNSTYTLVDAIEIGSFFSDVDSQMTYSWISESGFVSIDMIGTKIEGFSTKDVVGNDILRLVANDEEYVATYYFPVKIIPKESLSMEEDIVSTVQLGKYVDLQTQEFFMNYTGYVQAEPSIDENEILIATLTSDLNWNGVDVVNLSVYPVINSINPPRPPDTINNLPPGPIIPPIPYLEYAFYEFIVEVAPVNDPPYLIPHSPISMQEDETLLNAFNIEECFGDVDSQLQYAIINRTGNRLNPELAYGGKVNLDPETNWFGSGAVTIMAWDEEYDVTQEIYVWVLSVNDIPLSTEAPGAIYLDEDSVIVMNISDYISDVDDALWYSFGTAETNSSFELDESTWNLTVTPDENWNGIINLTIYASDAEFIESRNLTLNVAPVNDPPEIISRPSLSIMEGDELFLDMSSMIVDIDSELEFMVYSLGGKYVCEGARVSEYTMTPQSALWHGNDVLRIVATDGEYIVTLDLELEVISVNNPPMLNSGYTEITMPEDTTFSMNVMDMFEDVDTDALELTVVPSANIEVSFDSDNNVVTVRPFENWNGLSKIRIDAYDGYAWQTAEITVIVTAVNDPPEMVSSIPAVVLESGNSTVVSLGKHFRDIDSSAIKIQVLTYGNITVEPLEAFGSYRLGTMENWEGTDSLVIRVSDGESILETEMTITTVKDTVVIETSSADIGFIQSLSWMSVGIVIAVVAFAMYTITENRNARTRTATNKGRVL